MVNFVDVTAPGPRLDGGPLRPLAIRARPQAHFPALARAPFEDSMSHPSHALRLATVRKLTAELYALQDQMNATVDQITALLQGSELSAALAAPEALRLEAGGVERQFVPAPLALPLPQVFVESLQTGREVAPGCMFYTDNKNGQVQLVQVPAPRSSDSRHALHLNVAGFDGAWLSLVFDARALLEGLPAGRARLSLALEHRADPVVQSSIKLTWRDDGHPHDVQLSPRGGRTLVDSCEIPDFDPATTDAFDIHVIYTPHTRGSIELQRLVLTLSVQPEVHEDAPDVFESAA